MSNLRFRCGRAFRTTLLPSALVGSVLVLATTAHAAPTAADRETARALMDQGDQDVAKKDLAGALKAYRGADAIMHVPTTAIEVARTEEQLGLLVEAREAALAILRLPHDAAEPAAFVEARAAATAMSDRLAPRIPSIALRVTGVAAGAIVTVTFDGEAIPEDALGLPRRANPGAHAIVVTAAGYETARRDVKVAETDNVVVDVPLVPAAAGTPADTPAGKPPGRTRTYALFGIGAAGIVVGSVTGVLSLTKASSAHCTNDVCPPGKESDVSSAKTLAWTSDIAFGIGIAGVAVASVFYFTAPHDAPAKASASALRIVGGPTANGAALGVAGRF